MSQPPRRIRVGSVLIGMLVGLAYGAVGRTLDATLMQRGPAAYDIYHRAFDWIAPALFGLVAGVAVSYAQYRSARAEWADRRAEELRQRLAGTEQSQAVWVLASSLLHDLRNPLHTLALAITELGQRVDDPIYVVLVREAEAAIRRMKGKFEKLRDYAIDPAADRKDYRLDRVLGALREELDPIAARAGIELTVSCDEMSLTGDAALIRTALENLVSNALDSIAQSGVGGKVSVRVTRAADAVVVAVADDGPGLIEGVKDSIFEPLSSSKKPDQGLGLGLPIARALVRANGGELLLVRAEPGQTAFEVRFPAPGTL